MCVSVLRCASLGGISFSAAVPADAAPAGSTQAGQKPIRKRTLSRSSTQANLLGGRERSKTFDPESLEQSFNSDRPGSAEGMSSGGLDDEYSRKQLIKSQVRKTHLSRHFYTTNDHFTKTGSGQT
jgi:hypothetical protein